MPKIRPRTSIDFPVSTLPSFSMAGFQWGLLAVFLAGGGLLIGAAGLVRVPSASTTDPGRNSLSSRVPAQLTVTHEDRLPAGGALRERLRLLDPQPLFMTMEGWEGANGPEASVLRQSGAVVGAFPPALHVGPRSPALGLSMPSMRLSPVDVAARLTASSWFDGLAQEIDASPGDTARPRNARVEVYRVGTHERIVILDITRAAGLESMMWRPMTLTALINSAGAVVSPSVEASSGVDEIDERIRWIVARELLPTLRLRPGVYRFEVGP